MIENIETKDVVYSLARHVVHTKYDALPEEVVDAAKKSILDTLGVMIAGGGTNPLVKTIVDMVKETGGKEESTILGFGGKVPAWMAAFANGSMVHCLDYENADHRAGAHPSAQTIPAALAVAERLGGVSGKAFCTAIAIGDDLSIRMCRAVVRYSIWHKPVLFGIFAAAATSGKLLSLNEEQMVDALGLAFCQAAGTMELRWGVGSEIGGIRDAFPNKAGVLSALMAQRGIPGIKTSLEGRGGLFNVYFGGKYDRSVLTHDLGKRFLGTEESFKAWPACGGTHAYIDAALQLVRENEVIPRDVGQVTVFVGDNAQRLCEPLEARRKPVTVMDAKYSIPFSVAIAITKKRVTIDDYSFNALKDAAVLGLAEKITPKHDPQLNVWEERPPGVVEIRMRDGRTLSKKVDLPYGHVKSPLTWKDLVAKFEDCVSHGVAPISRQKVEKVIRLITRLEQVDDVIEIVHLLSPGAVS